MEDRRLDYTVASTTCQRGPALLGPDARGAALKRAWDDASESWAEHALDCQRACFILFDRAPCDEGTDLFAATERARVAWMAVRSAPAGLGMPR